MSESANKAVFLSYAREDTDAAKRICEALRAVGVEVWFDQSELVGGDQWDAKIRGQIKSCALFVPVISAATNARREGYFHREWKLAVDRTHDMDEALPFLLPVVIDATTDAGAFVPEKFREVQWTRLPGGETPGAFCSRVKQLLGGASELEPGRPRPGERDEGVASPVRRPPPRRWLGPAIIGVVAIATLAIWQPWKKTEPAPATGGSIEGPKPAAALSDAQQLVARALAISEKLTFTRDELAAAEDMTKRATDLEPGSARAWGVRAWMHAIRILRNWDRSEKHRQETESLARRALALDPDEPDALNALAQVMLAQGVPAQAESLANQALRVRPDDRRSLGLLAGALGAQGRRDEQRTLLGERVRRDPTDVIARYQIFLTYGQSGSQPSAADLVAALNQLDAALAVTPFASALMQKAMSLAGWKGDLIAMRATLDELEKLSAFERAEDLPLFAAMWGALLERKPDRVLAAAALTTRPYFEHVLIASPKAWYPAIARVLAGQTYLARLDWQAAESVLRERLRERPDAQLEQAQLAVTLAWLGKTDEAARLATPLEAMARETGGGFLREPLALYYAALGDAARAVPYLYAGLNRRPLLTDHTLPLDPWWDKLRGQPEFEALIAEAKARVAAVTSPSSLLPAPSHPPEADDKSVAVLAFANLSDDKGNEYFSDGISEELLNVLAKVPGLKVTARTSSFHFKGKDTPIPEIAKQLGVAYVVEGSVRKQGDKVRITAQLIKAADGFHVWSDTFTRDLKDIFAVQDEIAALIAQQLQLKLTTPERAKRVVDPEAHRLVLEGRHYLALRSEANFARSEEAFRAAVAIAPDLAVAHAGWAELAAQRGRYQQMAGLEARGSQLVEVQGHAERALRLDPNLAEPHAALAVALLDSSRLDEAVAAAAHGLAANPNYGSLYLWQSRIHAARGRLDLALGTSLRATELDPLAFVALYVRGADLVWARRFAEALPLLDRAASLRGEPFLPLQGERALVRSLLGRHDEAMALARKQLADPELISLGWWSMGEELWILRQSGAGEEAARQGEAILARLGPDNYLRGYVLCCLGRFEEGLPLLRQLPIIARSRFYYSPIFDPARETPAFRKLLVKLNCVEEYKVARATLARMLKEQETKK